VRLIDCAFFKRAPFGLRSLNADPSRFFFAAPRLPRDPQLTHVPHNETATRRAPFQFLFSYVGFLSWISPLSPSSFFSISWMMMFVTVPASIWSVDLREERLQKGFGVSSFSLLSLRRSFIRFFYPNCRAMVYLSLAKLPPPIVLPVKRFRPQRMMSLLSSNSVRILPQVPTGRAGFFSPFFPQL